MIKAAPVRPAFTRFLAQVNTPWKMRLYFLRSLPTLWWWGVRVRRMEAEWAEVTIPFGWRTQNPFRSTYFAALAGAAELSTGLLVLGAIQGRGRVSMLITQVEAQYTKKATGTVTFRCENGIEVHAAVERAVEDPGTSQVIRSESIGRLPGGQEVARLWFTWSVLAKDRAEK